jgi:hypothetical protein
MTTVLSFPVTNPCSGCGRQCADDEMSECLRCGHRYCKRHGCEVCACDRTAVELAQRAEIVRSL